MWTDIDVTEPDEKSIVTYVSLLYDIFPNVPSLEQSLRDNVSSSLYVSAFSLKLGYLDNYCLQLMFSLE